MMVLKCILLQLCKGAMIDLVKRVQDTVLKRLLGFIFLLKPETLKPKAHSTVRAFCTVPNLYGTCVVPYGRVRYGACIC